VKKYYQADFTAEQIGEVLAYSPTTGALTYKRASNRRAVGQLAGRVDTKGYFRVRLFGREFKSHRLAWLLTYGVWPEFEIDHINGLPGDNRLVNLRAVDASGNGQNRKKAMRNNKLGLLGVHRTGSKYTAQICVNKKQTVLGYFDTPEEAHQHYLAAKRALHPLGVG
jgi:hypothetical protein